MSCPLTHPPAARLPHRKPNKNKSLVICAPQECRAALTFAAAIDCNSIRRQTQAGLLPVCDIFAGINLTYTVRWMVLQTGACQLYALDIFSLPGSGHTSRLSTVSKAAFHTAAGLPLWAAA